MTAGQQGERLPDYLWKNKDVNSDMDILTTMKVLRNMQDIFLLKLRTVDLT